MPCGSRSAKGCRRGGQVIARDVVRQPTRPGWARLGPDRDGPSLARRLVSEPTPLAARSRELGLDINSWRLARKQAPAATFPFTYQGLGCLARSRYNRSFAQNAPFSPRVRAART